MKIDQFLGLMFAAFTASVAAQAGTALEAGLGINQNMKSERYYG